MWRFCPDNAGGGRLFVVGSGIYRNCFAECTDFQLGFCSGGPSGCLISETEVVVWCCDVLFPGW